MSRATATASLTSTPTTTTTPSTASTRPAPRRRGRRIRGREQARGADPTLPNGITGAEIRQEFGVALGDDEPVSLELTALLQNNDTITVADVEAMAKLLCLDEVAAFSTCSPSWRCQHRLGLGLGLGLVGLGLGLGLGLGRPEGPTSLVALRRCPARARSACDAQDGAGSSKWWCRTARTRPLQKSCGDGRHSVGGTGGTGADSDGGTGADCTQRVRVN